MPSLEFLRDFWRQKTIVPGLSYGVLCVILRFTVLVQYRLVTDGQTDTHDNSIYRASIASRGKIGAGSSAATAHGVAINNFQTKHY